MKAIVIAKSLMTKFQTTPKFDENKVGELNEVFHHNVFINSPQSRQNEIMLKSSQCKYENELEFPIDKYFGFNLKDILDNATVLDLGSFTGGRSVAYFERYGLKKIAGTDINQIYIDASLQYAKQKRINADFRIGHAEQIPFENEEFDAIISFDVFEHVQNLNETLEECYRLLKHQGRLIAVFPSYYHPFEHHLNLVTNFPCLHYIFSGKTLVRAYYEIIRERGDEAYWYKRDNPDLMPWEKGNTINGTTYRNFFKIVRKKKWEIEFVGRKPVGSVGRNIEKRKWLKTISKLMIPFTFVPLIQDLVLHRIVVILKKP